MPPIDQINDYVAPYSQFKEEGDRRIAASFEYVRNHLKGEKACQECNEIYSRINNVSEEVLEQITIIAALERERKIIYELFKSTGFGGKLCFRAEFFRKFPLKEITEEERAYDCELQARRNTLILATNKLSDADYAQYKQISLHVVTF
jgi:hypothetical protein